MKDVAVPVSINESQLSETSISLFPNPVQNEITLVFDQSIEKGEWAILNLQGQIQQSSSFSVMSSRYLPIDASQLEDGFYLIKLSIGKQVQTYKFIKH